MDTGEACGMVQPISMKIPGNGYASRNDAVMLARSSASVKHASALKSSPRFGDCIADASTSGTYSKSQARSRKEDEPLPKNYVRADPSYLQTLGQAHSGWIFGAIAELVDNSRDAKANK